MEESKAPVSICRGCAYYHGLDALTGECKVRHAERHVVGLGTHSKDIIDGWPIVKGDSECCGEAK